MPAFIDRTGLRFGRLVALEHFGGRKWNFQCDCGKQHVTDIQNVVKGRTSSCGCLNEELKKTRVGKMNASYKHGQSSTAEYRAEYSKNYRQKNRESLLEKKRVYGRQNRKKLSESTKRWRVENPDKVAILTAKHNARRRPAKMYLPTKKLAEKLVTQNNRCHWCNDELIKKHLDHVVPVSRGGEHTLENTVWACPACNLQKSALMVDEWFQKPNCRANRGSIRTCG